MSEKLTFGIGLFAGFACFSVILESDDDEERESVVRLVRSWSVWSARGFKTLINQVRQLSHLLGSGLTRSMPSGFTEPDGVT